MLVARPTGVYCSHPNKGMVWLASRGPATRFRQPRDFLANKNGPETRLAPRSDPGHSEGNFAMDKAPYSRTQTKHTAAIDRLVASYPGTQKHGFWAAIRKLAEETDSEIPEQPFRPDAYRLDYENEVIEIHEVVVSHEPTERLLHSLGIFWMDWDSEGQHEWLPTLYVHREGVPPQQYDLCFWYHHYLSSQFGREGELDNAQGFIFPTRLNPEAS